MSIRKYKLKNGSIRYEARAYLNGRGSKQVCRSFPRKSDAEAYLKILHNQLKEAVSPEFSFENTTFQREADFWYDYQKCQLAPSSKKRVLMILNEFNALIGRLKPNELHLGKLVCLQKDLLKTGIAPQTVNKKIGLIHTVLNFSAKMKRIPYNPCSGYPKLKETHNPMKFWTKEEATKFLEFANVKYPFNTESRWIYIVYLLAINTGLRAGEIWGLTPDSFDFDSNLILVTKQFDRVGKTLRELKNGKSRRAPCNASLQVELKHWMNFAEIKFNETVFQRSERRPVIHDDFVRQKYLRDVRQAEVRPIRFHDLRHTAGTLIASSGSDLVTVKTILGHASIKTTMGYVHAVAENVQKVAKDFSVEPRVCGKVLELKNIGQT